MEALGSVWIPIGLITASLMAIFDKDMRSTGMLVFMTLLGPITILVAAFMLIYAFASDSSSPQAKAKTKPNESPRVCRRQFYLSHAAADSAC